MAFTTKYDMKEILGEDFFKEEVKCDYRISEAQKMVCAMQLELYLIFKDICNKYKLKHWIMYGSLLGAVRHNGFIPWDDDIDVAMPRKDFNLFLEVAPKELSEPYSLQCPYTVPNCFITNVTMRNSNGTFTPKVFRKLDYNKGIPLDIFPFDYCNIDKWRQDREEIFGHVMKCASWMKMQHPELLSKGEIENCRQFCTDHPLDDWEAIQRIASKSEYEGAEHMMMKVVLDRYHLERDIVYNSSWFEKTIPHKFETVEVEIPVGWHDVLCVRYGEHYMEYPPVEKRGAINEKIIVNPFIPYRQYDFDNCI